MKEQDRERLRKQRKTEKKRQKALRVAKALTRTDKNEETAREMTERRNKWLRTPPSPPSEKKSAFFDDLLSRADQFGDVATAREIFSNEAYGDMGKEYLERLKQKFPEAYANLSPSVDIKTTTTKTYHYVNDKQELEKTIYALHEQETIIRNNPKGPDLDLISRLVCERLQYEDLLLLSSSSST